MSDYMPSAASRVEPRWRIACCFLLTLVAIQLALGPVLRLSQWDLRAAHNSPVAEGESWLQGRLDIPHPGRDVRHDRMHDAAYFQGKVYNVYPPLLTVLHAVLAPLHGALQVGHTEFWHPWTHLLLVYWPLPVLGFFVFRRECGDSAWAGLLTLVWLGGTALLPALTLSQRGYQGPTYHVLSQTGLLLLAADLLGRQRIWPGLIGLLIAAWSRQMTFLYALPLLWVAYQRRRLPLALAGLALVAAPLLVLNWLKFGNPLDFGYQYIYVERETDIMGSRVAAHGVFSLHFFVENFRHMHWQPPALDLQWTSIGVGRDRGFGVSIWITTPLLLLLVPSFRAWWRDPRRRALMLGTLPIMLGLLCYHTPGYLQSGYNRFALDFIPIWLLVLAPHVRGGWRTWFTLLSGAWSLLYFQSVASRL